MSAADVIRHIHDRLSSEDFTGVQIVQAQGGPPAGGTPNAVYFTGALTRGAEDGELKAQRGPILFADRRDVTERPMQPFHAGAPDTSEFTFSIAGTVREQSFTWDFTQEVVLQDVGNNVLTGWGGSIGNSGQPSYWVVVFDNIFSRIPG